MNALAHVDDQQPSLSLTLPEGLSFDRWVSIGRRLCASSQVINWQIGDWWAFGDHEYGDRAKAAAEGIFGREFQTLRNVGAISRSFETSRRRDALSWSHHAEVAVLAPDVADELLERAERENLSTRDLRKAVLAIRSERVTERRIAHPPIDIRPEPSSEEDGIAIEGTSLAEMIIELAEALGRERELTPRESLFLEKALRVTERRFPTSLAPWTADDELRLVEMLKSGQRPPEIAPALGRTLGATWRQINRMGGINRILHPEPVGSVGRLGLGIVP